MAKKKLRKFGIKKMERRHACLESIDIVKGVIGKKKIRLTTKIATKILQAFANEGVVISAVRWAEDYLLSAKGKELFDAQTTDLRAAAKSFVRAYNVR